MKDHSGIILDRDLVENLQNAISDLEYKADNAIKNSLYRNNACMAASLELREKIFQLIALVANLEEDLNKRFRVIITEYLEQIYAFHAKLEEDMEVLENDARKTLRDN